MKKTLLSGMQPTSHMHLGNYHGALENWAKLQNSGNYDCYNCIVDWHSLTTGSEITKILPELVHNMAADFIAGGLDPEKSAIFVQSHIKEHAELYLLLSNIVPLGWLYRVPTYKEKAEALGLDNLGFLGYPVLQTADIIVYKADVVPVGADQRPHIELAREIVRRFNHLFDENVFPEPQTILNKISLLLGTDGRKMSKSYDNDIKLSDDKDTIKKKIMSSYTDSKKIHKNDPGHPEQCPVFMFHNAYNQKQEVEEIKHKCKTGDDSWGCVKCKRKVIPIMNEFLEPIRSKRKELLEDRAELDNILAKGADKAREKAQETMSHVRKVMNLK